MSNGTYWNGEVFVCGKSLLMCVAPRRYTEDFLFPDVMVDITTCSDLVLTAWQFLNSSEDSGKYMEIGDGGRVIVRRQTP